MKGKKRVMQWIEYIGQINRDEIDNNAIERYSFWRSQIMDITGDSIGRRKMVCLYSLDPDIANEFCFYMPQYWDRLINRAKMFESANDFSYEKKLQRAIMIMYGTDPDIIPDEDVPHLWWNGGVFKDLHTYAMKKWDDYSIPFDNVAFAFNRVSGAISMRVNDGSGRTYQLTPTDFECLPDLKAIIFGEKSEDTFYLPINEENIDDESDWIPM